MKVEKLKEFMGENEKKQMKEDIAVQDATYYTEVNLGLGFFWGGGTR